MGCCAVTALPGTACPTALQIGVQTVVAVLVAGGKAECELQLAALEAAASRGAVMADTLRFHGVPPGPAGLAFIAVGMYGKFAVMPGGVIVTA